jgi:hypothetical protein
MTAAFPCGCGVRRHLWKPVHVDVLISVVLGVVALIILIVWIMSVLGVGQQFLEPVTGLFGAPFIRLSRKINDAGRERSIEKLPPDVPPPPPAL